MTWLDIGTIDDIPQRGARCVKTPQGKIGVFRTHDDQIYAIEDHCPHKGGPLSQGIVHGAAVTCPLHNWVISLETGKAGEEDGHGAEGELDHSMLLTDPDEAADFVSRTQVDALAIAIGTSHGAYKFTSKPSGKVLRIDRVKEIHQRIPNVHLVMHGSSSVPEDWLAIINQHGGDMGQTYGVPVEEIVEGIRNGVRKVNIDTDLRMASTGAIRRHLAEDKKNFDPRKFYKEATKAMQAICAARYEVFGAAGMASKITKVHSLEAMQKRYDKGELAARVA